MQGSLLNVLSKFCKRRRVLFTYTNYGNFPGKESPSFYINIVYNRYGKKKYTEALLSVKTFDRYNISVKIRLFVHSCSHRRKIYRSKIRSEVITSTRIQQLHNGWHNSLASLLIFLLTRRRGCKKARIDVKTRASHNYCILLLTYLLFIHKM